MKWIARLGEREETVEIPAPRGHADPPKGVGEGLAPSHVAVRIGADTLTFDVGAGLAPALASGANGGSPARKASIIIDGRQVEVAVLRLSKSRYQVSIDGRAFEVTVDDQLGVLTREAEGARGGKGGTVTAYMPGKVVAVLVEEGAEVGAGEGVVVLEAMKMENEIQAEVDGVVSKVHVQPGQPVEGGDPLFEVEVR